MPRRAAFALLLAFVVSSASAQLVPPSTAPAATAPAASLPSARNTDALLPSNKVQFDFSNEPVANVTAFVASSFNLRLIDPYKLQQTITMKFREPMGAREAIDMLDQ